MAESTVTKTEKQKTNTSEQIGSLGKVRQTETISPVADIMHLQNTLGNQAIGQVLQTKLKINKPGDKYEQEADRIANIVMHLPDSEVESVSQTEDKIQRKPLASQITPLVQRNENNTATPEVTPLIATKINAMRSGGQPLPEVTRRFFEPRFGADFSSVRVHFGSSAQVTAKKNNAYAYTIGQDIVFGTGQYSPGSLSGQKLLAHELTHTLQQGKDRIKQKIQRKPITSSHKDFQQLPESIYVVAKKDSFLFSSTSEFSANKIKISIGDRLELVFQSKNKKWYFAFSEFGEKGYVESKNLIFPPNINIKESPIEEFVASVGDVIFIQAISVNRAFRLAKKANLKPNIGMIFWYSDGRKKPYPIKFHITIREPSSSDIEQMRKLANFSTLTIPTAGTLGGATIARLSPNEKKYQEAAKELEPYVDEYILQESKKYPGKLARSVQEEWLIAIENKFEEFRSQKGIPVNFTAGSDFMYYRMVFDNRIRDKIKEVVSPLGKLLKDPQYNPVNFVGSLEWLVEAKKKIIKENEGYLQKQFERISKKEHDKRRTKIEAFLKPYKEKLKADHDAFIEKSKKKISRIEGWYNQEVARKTAYKVIEQRQQAVLRKAQADFEKTPLAEEIRETVERQYALIEKRITNPDPFKHPAFKDDTVLIAMLSDFNRQIETAKNFKERVSKLNASYKNLREYLISKYPGKYQSLVRLIMVYFSNKLVDSKDGKISVYAVKYWAELNYRILSKARDDYGRIYGKHFVDINKLQRLTTIGGYPFTTKAYADLGFELHYAKEFFEKIVNHPENDEGFWDGFTSKSLGEFIPFVSSLLSMSKLSEQLRVARKKEMGGMLTPGERMLLEAVSGLRQINAMKEKPFWYEVGEGVAEAIPFIGEFMLTAPIGLGVTKISIEVMERTMRKMATEYLEKRLVKFVIKGVGVLAGTMAQTLANPLDIMNNITTHGMHVVKLVKNEDGSFTVEVEANDASKASAIWKGFISSYVNVLTERVGGKVLPFLASKASGAFSRFIPMVGRHGVLSAYLKKTGETLSKYAGFHGILGEYEEEIYSQVLESLLKGEQLKWSWEDQLKTFTVVGILGSSMRGLQTVIAANDIFRSFKFEGRKVTLPADVYLILTKLTNENQMMHFEQELARMKLSDQQKQLALYLAKSILAIENEISTSRIEIIAGQDIGPIPQRIRELTDLVIRLYTARKNLLFAKQKNETDHVESVSLKGEGDVSVPLLLYNLEHVDQWIRETELAIAKLDGVSLEEIKEVAKVENGVEENIQLWKNWQAGWRSYIAKAKALSPESNIELDEEGKLAINGNMTLSTRVLQRMTSTDLENLQRLLKVSFMVAELEQQPIILPELAEGELSEMGRLHRESTVTFDASKRVSFNNEIQVSPQLLHELIVTQQTKDKDQAEFLFVQSFFPDSGRIDETTNKPKTLDSIEAEIKAEKQLLRIVKKKAAALYDIRRKSHQPDHGEDPNAIRRHKIAMAEREIIQAKLKELKEYKKELTRVLRKNAREEASSRGFDSEIRRAAIAKWIEMILRNYPAIDGARKKTGSIGEVWQHKSHEATHANWREHDDPEASIDPDMVAKDIWKVIDAVMITNNSYKWTGDLYRKWNTTMRDEGADKFGFEMPENWRDPSIAFHLDIEIVGIKPKDWDMVNANLQEQFRKAFPKNAQLEIYFTAPSS